MRLYLVSGQKKIDATRVAAERPAPRLYYRLISRALVAEQTETYPVAGSDSSGDWRRKEAIHTVDNRLNRHLVADAGRPLVNEVDLLDHHGDESLGVARTDAEKHSGTQEPVVIFSIGGQDTTHDQNNQGSEVDGSTADGHGEGHADEIANTHEHGWVCHKVGDAVVSDARWPQSAPPLRPLAKCNNIPSAYSGM